MNADISGAVFGRLTVLSLVFKDRQRNGHWRCNCQCGNETVVSLKDLSRGHTRSCGCLRKAHTTHGCATKGNQSREYRSWLNMKDRCLNKNNSRWERYGGRGITFCERWLKFENFLADMGKRPLDKTLDRKDNDGNYEPGNCRWATRKEQANNKTYPNAAKTHCKRGHEFSPENTRHYLNDFGKPFRRCATCDCDRERRKRREARDSKRVAA